MARKGSRFAPHGAPAAFIEHAVAYESDECLIWPYGTRDHGKNSYGVIHIEHEGKRRTIGAHRVVLERTQGPAPKPGMVAAHAPVVCHNPQCVNPRHLRWATKRENANDRWLDGTIGAIGNLSRDDVEWIRLYESRVKRAAMAHMFGVSVGAIKAIQQGTVYKHVTINGRVTVPGQRWKPVDEGTSRAWPPRPPGPR